MTAPRRHGRRLVALWVFLSVAAVLAIVLLLGPHLPPGDMSSEATDQRRANTILAAIAAPIVVGIASYLVYATIFFRSRAGAEGDGPHDIGSGRIQIWWVAVTTTLVLFAAGYGTYELLFSASGAGGGQGPDPVARPAGYRSALKVQVIGQQWNWTYRFPQLGRFETVHLKLPVDRVVELHVTSLDVAHSFWAHGLGVKADAMPGADNVAYVRPNDMGSFEIRCAELCGLWHGHMFQSGEVVSAAAFEGWIGQQKRAESGFSHELPPYRPYYYPDPQRRAG